MLKHIKRLWQHYYVKGHQLGPDLQWEAQLNNKAYSLATKAKLVINPMTGRKYQSMLPAADIHLTINDAMSRSLPCAITEEYTSSL
eukprot:11591786-Ditylum_brightwellii.AAC.1